MSSIAVSIRGKIRELGYDRIPELFENLHCGNCMNACPVGAVVRR